MPSSKNAHENLIQNVRLAYDDFANLATDAVSVRAHFFDKRKLVVTRSRLRAPGLLGSKSIKWNFTKFLVGKDGQVIKRYAPLDKPADLAKDIEAALAA
jgi:glutathione peroxidase-family protein